jgi:hypothetical protein
MMGDRPQKITFAEMRAWAFAWLSIAPTIAAVIRLRSAPTISRMTFAFPISSRGLCAGPAASAVPTCGRISIGGLGLGQGVVEIVEHEIDISTGGVRYN